MTCQQELYFAPEIERVAEELHQQAGEPERAEACLQKAIQLARLQGATAWELKAGTALGSLWQSQGKPTQAQTMLAPIFTQCETELSSPDVILAQNLLGRLAEQAQRP